jgi:glycosyltransferase involved in cell wall biosynthesis
MYDILFDFSSSPAGGGLRRLEAYAEYFSRSPLKIHFFVHAAASNLDKIQRLVPTTLVHKTGASKVRLNKDYIKKIGTGAKWLFSYGIPTKRGYSDQNWLHISNVSPFFFFHMTVSTKFFLKMLLLRWQFKVNCQNNDIISAESDFSIKMYVDLTGWGGESLLLRNGLDKEEPDLEIKQPYAIAIGTHSYKRIDLTYKVFQALKDDLGLKKLLIVGESKQIPLAIRTAFDVEAKGFIPNTATKSMLRSASYFISTSEVENSSNAVLEGLQHTKKAILSNIPSHQEMLKSDSDKQFQFQGKDYLIVNQNDVSDDAIAEWSSEISKMLWRMGFSKCV